MPNSGNAGVRGADSTPTVLAAIGTGLPVFFPDGWYDLTGISPQWTGKPLRLYGKGAAPIGVDEGPILNFVGSGGPLMHYHGACTPTRLRIKGLKFRAENPTGQCFGLKLTGTFDNRILESVFEGFTPSGGAGIYLSGNPGNPNSGTVNTVISGNAFGDSCMGIYSDFVNTSCLTIADNTFEGSLNNSAIRGGDFSGSPFSTLSWRIRDNTFASTVPWSDIWFTGGAVNTVIEGNEFEWWGLSKTPIGFANTINCPLHQSISIRDNLFAGDVATGQAIVYVRACDGFTAEGNAQLVSMDASRYFVLATDAVSNVRIQRPSAMAGATPVATCLHHGIPQNAANYSA